MLTAPQLIEPGNFETEDHFYPQIISYSLPIFSAALISARDSLCICYFSIPAQGKKKSTWSAVFPIFGEIVSPVTVSKANSVSKSVTMMNRGECRVTTFSDFSRSMHSCKSLSVSCRKKSFFFHNTSSSFLDWLYCPLFSRVIEAFGRSYARSS